MTSSEEFNPEFTRKQIQEFASENDFMYAYVELFKQCISLLVYSVQSEYYDENDNPKVLERDTAVIGGNLVRLIKLNTSFLQNTCERKLEICQILNRCIAETAINILYMLGEKEESVIKNYVKYSLLTEKELSKTISTNIENNGGSIKPIEHRMQKSIELAFDKSDFDFEEVNRSSKWKSIKSRAETIYSEVFYKSYFGISSHSIHGNWLDIYFNNLNREDSGFTVNMEWQTPRPQILDGPVWLTLNVCSEFLKREDHQNELGMFLAQTTNQLESYFTMMSQEHENFLTN